MKRKRKGNYTPIYDRSCTSCEHKLLDKYEPITPPEVPCPECGSATQRVWLGQAAFVIGDDIPGGLWVEHAICNPDGSPKKYYSKSEMAKAAKAKGYENQVEHRTSAYSGSDKNKNTQRWY